MSKFFAPIFLCVFTLNVNAQTQPIIPETQPFGKIDKADLELKSCDFEKEANAEVLFDKEDAYYIDGAVLDRHKRIKIFNDKGTGEANIRLEYLSIDNYEHITGLEAETINLVDGKIEITKVDKKQIYTERVDVERNAIVFAFPNVKAGSVIEFKYRLSTYFLNIPNWYFQSEIPERYNEMTIQIPHSLFYKTQLRANQPFLKNSDLPGSGTVNKHIYAMENVMSFNDEPFMSSWEDNVQSAYFQITGVYGYGGGGILFDKWDTVGDFLIRSKFFGYEMNTHISGQSEILKNVKLLSSTDQKIAYIFNLVKNEMKWDGADGWYTDNGVSKAWDLKAGNGTEINLILHSLLTAAGIEAYPFMVSTRKNGKINPAYPTVSQFNRAVVYVKAGDGNNYILDASNKYNVYNDMPSDLLNSFGLLVDNDHKNFKTIFIEKEKPVTELVFVNAEIKPNGVMEGVAQKSSYSYLRNRIAESYKKDGEKIYRESLKDNNNSISILDLKMENMDTDSLPLKQQISFKNDLSGSGADYLYFDPNIFSAFRENPFLSEKRLSDIDFGYLTSYSIIGVYKLPAGYKTEGLPKNVRLEMPDKSISFTRIVAEQDGALSARYAIDVKKSIFLKEDYAGFREFYKKMYELLNEQIVLKKL